VEIATPEIFYFLFLAHKEANFTSEEKKKPEKICKIGLNATKASIL
jgi:hypothetical protein